eukprot:ctg_1650.g455
MLRGLSVRTGRLARRWPWQRGGRLRSGSPAPASGLPTPNGGVASVGAAHGSIPCLGLRACAVRHSGGGWWATSRCLSSSASTSSSWSPPDSASDSVAASDAAHRNEKHRDEGREAEADTEELPEGTAEEDVLGLQRGVDGVISALRQGRTLLAARAYQELDKGALHKDVAASRSLVVAAGRAGASELGLALYRDLFREDLLAGAERVNRLDANYLLRAIAPSGNVEVAEEIFGALRERDGSSHAALIDTYFNAGQARRGIEFGRRVLGAHPEGVYAAMNASATPGATAEDAAVAAAEAVETEEEASGVSGGGSSMEPAGAPTLSFMDYSVIYHVFIEAFLRMRQAERAHNVIRTMRERHNMRVRMPTLMSFLVRAANANIADGAYMALLELRRDTSFGAYSGLRCIDQGSLLSALNCAARNQHAALADMAWAELRTRYLSQEELPLLPSSLHADDAAAAESTMPKPFFEVPDALFYARANAVARCVNEPTTEATVAAAAGATPGASSGLPRALLNCMDLIIDLHHRRHARRLRLASADANTASPDPRAIAPRLLSLRGVVTGLASDIRLVDGWHFELVRRLEALRGESSAATATTTTTTPQSPSSTVTAAVFKANTWSPIKDGTPLLTPFNIAIAAGGAMADLDRALQSYEVLERDGPAASLQPNTDTFHALLDACARRRHVDAALHVMEKMRKAKMEPVGETHRLLVRAMVRGARLREAADYIRERTGAADEEQPAAIPLGAYRLVARYALAVNNDVALVREMEALAKQAGYGAARFASTEASLSGGIGG